MDVNNSGSFEKLDAREIAKFQRIVPNEKYLDDCS